MLWTSLRCHTRPAAAQLRPRLFSLASPISLSRPSRTPSILPPCRGFSFRPTLRLRQREAPMPQGTEPRIQTFRERVGPTIPNDAFVEVVGRPGMRNQVLFVAFGSFFAFIYAASQTNRETEFWTHKLTAVSQLWSLGSVTSVDLRRAQNAELVRYLREWYSSLTTLLSSTHGLIRPWFSLAFVSVLQPYADASEGKRLCWKICLLNAAVYLAWKVRAWRPAMNRSFMHYPLSGLSYTLLTSVFSHRSFLHLLMNCLALESFGSAANFFFIKEQAKADPPMLESTATYHFLAFFVSAGLFSSLVSHTVNVKFRYPKAIVQLATNFRSVPRVDTWAAAVAQSTSKGGALKSSLSSTAKATSPAASSAAAVAPTILPSLGASGAIYAAVTLTALAFPDAQVALFIPPSYPMDIQTAVGAAVLLDVVGIWRGWRLFDHCAHLGGAAFGVLYYAYGPRMWNDLRRIDEEVVREAKEGLGVVPPGTGTGVGET